MPVTPVHATTLPRIAAAQPPSLPQPAAFSYGVSSAAPAVPTSASSATTLGAGFVGPIGPVKSDPDVRPVDPGNPAGKLAGNLLKKALDGALRADPAASYAIDRASNSATFLSGSFKVAPKPGVGNRPVDVVAREFLKDHGQLFGVTDAQAELKLLNASTDQLGFAHYRYQQYHEGLPVFGQQLVVHAQGEVVRSVGGRLTPTAGVHSVAPKLDGTAVAALVAKSSMTENGGPIAVAGKPVLGIYTTEDGAPHLAYELDLANDQADGRWRYYMDANSGQVLDSWALVHSAINRETYDAKNRTSQGQIARREGGAPVADVHINEAHDNAGAVYDFYKEQFGRDSIDGRGMKLTSTVHYGNKYNNAFWDGSKMTYGDGDGVRFTHFGDALDVVGHEMAHGVTERTAGMRYYRQSGALNESWSDVFGNLIEKWDEHRKDPSAGERDPKWLLGEEIFTPGKDGDALRSMSSPGKGYEGDPQPGHMRDYKNTSADNGGVHINSGIPNKAAYEVAQSIGADKLGQIWYRAVTEYLTSSSQFTDAANVTVQAAADLFGPRAAEVAAVRDAWTSVGLTPTGSTGTSTTAANTE